MKTHESHISAATREVLAVLLGQTPLWIYARHLLVTATEVIAPTFSLDIGTGGEEFLSIGSVRMETPLEYIDYFEFTVARFSGTAGGTLPERLVLMENISAIHVAPLAKIVGVEIATTTSLGDRERVAYDGTLKLLLADRRSLVFGHAPTVYEGTSFKIAPP